MTDYDRQYLQDLADEPIRTAERASRIWLPKGKRPGSRLSDEERAANRSNASARRALEGAATLEKRAKLLAYYATTDLPAERVAAHVGIPVDEAQKSLDALRRPA